MDLFYTPLKPRAQLIKLRKEIGYTLYKDIPKSFRILVGDIENIGNCALIIFEHITKEKFMRAGGEKYIITLCRNKAINNTFFTYSCFKECKSASRNDILYNRQHIHMIIDILKPVVIVVVGENTLLSFENRKQLLFNKHGEIVSTFNGIPVILTYEGNYYIKKGRQDEVLYKRSIQDIDWQNISNIYNKLITKG